MRRLLHADHFGVEGGASRQSQPARGEEGRADTEGEHRLSRFVPPRGRARHGTAISRTTRTRRGAVIKPQIVPIGPRRCRCNTNPGCSKSKPLLLGRVCAPGSCCRTKLGREQSLGSKRRDRGGVGTNIRVTPPASHCSPVLLFRGVAIATAPSGSSTRVPMGPRARGATTSRRRQLLFALHPRGDITRRSLLSFCVRGGAGDEAWTSNKQGTAS